MVVCPRQSPTILRQSEKCFYGSGIHVPSLVLVPGDPSYALGKGKKTGVSKGIRFYSTQSFRLLHRTQTPSTCPQLTIVVGRTPHAATVESFLIVQKHGKRTMSRSMCTQSHGTVAASRP